MELKEFSSKNLKLLMEIHKKGMITSKDQKTYSPFAFYLNIGFLEKSGLVEDNGYDKDRRKLWSLTQKGKKFVVLLMEIQEVLREL